MRKELGGKVNFDWWGRMGYPNGNIQLASICESETHPHSQQFLWTLYTVPGIVTNADDIGVYQTLCQFS